MVLVNDFSLEKAQKHLNKVIHGWEEKPQLNFEMAVISKRNQKKLAVPEFIWIMKMIQQ